MEATVSLAFAALIGFSHAFEADHLVAVSAMATRRNHPLLAVKDGLFWGLGHSSTFLLIGLLMIVGKVAIAEQTFSYLEAGVGVMLLGLGGLRLRALTARDTPIADQAQHTHGTAYGVGLVHGLAGSGVLIMMLMSQLDSTSTALLFILLFGLGSVVGMLLAAGVFSLPFSKKLATHKGIRYGLALLSALLCLYLGSKIILENIWQ